MVRFVSAAVLLAACLAGCTAGGETRRYQTRMIPDAQPEQVFASARDALRTQFGRVEASPDQREITTVPIRYQSRGGNASARGLLRRESPMRQVAHCRVVPRAGGALVMLRVDIERQDTESAEAVGLRTGGRLDDMPSYTPIDRDAGTTEAQNTVWTFVRRDAQLERELLTEIENEFATEPAPSELPAQNGGPQ